MNKAFEELRAFHPEVDCLDHNAEGFQDGDEKAPFFSEAYLYNLIGKDDARTLLRLIRNIGKELGYSDRELFHI